MKAPRIATLVAVGLALSAPARADPTDPFLGGIISVPYSAVDGAGNPMTDPTQVNPDGTFKATCVGCEWVVGESTGPQVGYHTPVVGAANPATGNAAVAGADGLLV